MWCTHLSTVTTQPSSVLSVLCAIEKFVITKPVSPKYGAMRIIIHSIRSIRLELSVTTWPIIAYIVWADLSGRILNDVRVIANSPMILRSLETGTVRVTIFVVQATAIATIVCLLFGFLFVFYYSYCYYSYSYLVMVILILLRIVIFIINYYYYYYHHHHYYYHYHHHYYYYHYHHYILISAEGCETSL